MKLGRKKLASGNTSLFLDYMVNGKRQKDYLNLVLDGSKSDKDILRLAEDICAKRRLEMSSQPYGFIPDFKRKMDFINFFTGFISTLKKPNQIKRTEYTLRHLKLFILGIHHKREITSDTEMRADKVILPAYQVTTHFLISFHEYLCNCGLRGTTPFDYFGRMKVVLRKAVREGLFATNPADNIHPDELQRKADVTKLFSKEVLDIEEIQLLANTPCSNPEIKRAFLFATYTGLRYGDLYNLTWEQIRKIYVPKANQEITVIDWTQGKTEQYASGRNILSLNETALRLTGEPGEGRIFNIPKTVKVYNKHVNQWVKAAGINKYITSHCARHTFGTNLIAFGNDLKTTAASMGHSTTRCTEKYVHINQMMQKRASDSIPSINLNERGFF